MLADEQHGFIIGRSCITQLISTLEEWTAILDNGGQVDAIYMDFMKAFDKVPHERLLHKLEGYGVKGNVLKWIRSFLCHRTQKVVVCGSQSDWAEVTSGIPQGTVLGPTLFLAYINDLPQTTSSPIVLFADDTKAFRQINGVTDCLELQADLNKLQDWANKWQMKFHPEKCRVLRMGSNPPPFEYPMTENNITTTLEVSPVEKDLGVLVDHRLKFKQHITATINKGNQMLGLIRRSFQHLDSQNMLLLYKGMVRPILEYGNTIWYPHLKQDIVATEAIQRRATKLIPELRDLSYEDRLRRLSLPTLAHRRLHGDMINVYKYLHGKYSVKRHPFKMANRKTTRGHALKLQKQYSRLDLRKFFFTNRVVEAWNALPDHVVLAPTLNAFKNKFDKHWQNVFSFDY